MNDSNNFTMTLGAQDHRDNHLYKQPGRRWRRISKLLAALTTVGAGNVSVSSSEYTTSPFYVPPGPITAYQGYSISIQRQSEGHT